MTSAEYSELEQKLRARAQERGWTIEEMRPCQGSSNDLFWQFRDDKGWGFRQAWIDGNTVYASSVLYRKAGEKTWHEPIYVDGRGYMTHEEYRAYQEAVREKEIAQEAERCRYERGHHSGDALRT